MTKELNTPNEQITNAGDAVDHSQITAAKLFADASPLKGSDIPLQKSTADSHLPQLLLADAAAPATTTDASAGGKSLLPYTSAIAQDATNLAGELKALQGNQKGSEAYNKDLAALNGDEQKLRQDVTAFRHAAPDFQSFSTPMQAEHSALKNVADGLWKMGLKDQASETTAYFPLSHYKKYFDNSGSGTGSGGSGGTGGDGGSGAPGNATVQDNMDTASLWKPNTKANEIGGSGKVDSELAQQVGPNDTRYTVTGGAYGDGLWSTSNKSAAALSAKHIELDASFKLTDSDLQNDHEIEKDILVKKADGAFGIAGTQINPKTGEVDYWNTQKSQWVDVGNIGPLQANKNYDLKLGITVNDTGNVNTSTYNYDNYSLNGTKLNASQTMFNTKAMNWSPGVYIQTQLDLGKVADHSVAGMDETGEKMYMW
jgi:hypothetical protein